MRRYRHIPHRALQKDVSKPSRSLSFIKKVAVEAGDILYAPTAI
jgi:hypothetical protein